MASSRVMKKRLRGAASLLSLPFIDLIWICTTNHCLTMKMEDLEGLALGLCIYKINRYKDYINRTCQVISLVNPIHILQCAGVHECTVYHLLSVNEHIVIYSRQNVAGWIFMIWNRQSPDLYPSDSPPPFHLLWTQMTNPCLEMSQCLSVEIEVSGLKCLQFAGNL